MGKEQLKELGEWLGYSFEGTYDESEGVPTGSARGDVYLFFDNYSRVTGVPLRKVWEDSGSEVIWDELERFQTAYQDFKSHNGIMDFTDMLDSYVSMCEPSNAEIVYVDEAQDLSWSQWRVLRHAFHNAKKVVIAGDDDQSIYKWSGADNKTFLELGGSHTTLTQSYRLPKSVFNAAQGIIGKVSKRYEKVFAPTENEGCVEYINDIHYCQLDRNNTSLILVRNTYLETR